MSIAREVVGYAVKSKASDIHIEEGKAIAFRISSDIHVANNSIISNEQMTMLLQELTDRDGLEGFQNSGDLDTSIGLDGISRVRVNAYMSKGKRCLTLRILPDNLPDWRDLGLPDSFMKLAERHRGLVLCTGPTGSGKSTSLAALINYMMETQSRHILTIEDPIEFHFENKGRSIVHQREVGKDTKSFNAALKAALREDPDVIYIGEMRDLETIQLAITAAETGHLVLGTLHTSSAAKTCERIIDVFPADQQEQARLQVSTSLAGIMSQTLCKKIGGGRALGYEIMINTPAVANMIREKQISQLYSTIQTGTKDGMITLEQCLSSLIKMGHIERSEGIEKASNPKLIA